jgi:hypothetical protein
LTKGRPIRAVTFQSTERGSSPSTYSRTSANSTPAAAERRPVAAGQHVGYEPAALHFDAPHLGEHVGEAFSRGRRFGRRAVEQGHRRSEPSRPRALFDALPGPRPTERARAAARTVDRAVPGDARRMPMRVCRSGLRPGPATVSASRDVAP